MLNLIIYLVSMPLTAGYLSLKREIPMSLQKNKKFIFEDGVNKLEEIVQKLESGNLTLNDSLKYFEEGIMLSRLCTKQLNEVEKRIEILIKNEHGDLIPKPFIDKKTDNEDSDTILLNSEIEKDKPEIKNNFENQAKIEDDSQDKLF